MCGTASSQQRDATHTEDGDKEESGDIKSGERVEKFEERWKKNKI